MCKAISGEQSDAEPDFEQLSAELNVPNPKARAQGFLGMSGGSSMMAHETEKDSMDEGLEEQVHSADEQVHSADEL